MTPACVYCGASATTRDHVPPKCLLETPYPNNLSVVPSCGPCNNAFSLDEQYFLTIMANISNIPTLVSKVEEGGIVDRTLTRAPRLDDRLIEALDINEEDGRVFIRPEIERINRVIRKISQGLFFKEYKCVPSLNEISHIAAYPYDETVPLSQLVSRFIHQFEDLKWTHIQLGVFSYIIIPDKKSGNRLWLIMDFYQTLWGIACLPNPI